MAIVRSISKTLDISKPYNIDNAFTICRGDNVDFTFTFKNNGNTFDISTATKARIFAKRIHKDGVHTEENPIFSKELTLSSPTNVSCSFTSLNTAYEEGQYLLSVILLDANESTLTTQTIPFELFNQGYAGIVQPAQDFRDEVLDIKEQTKDIRDEALAAAATATNKANQAGTSATDAYDSATTATNKASEASTYALKAEGYAVGTSGGEDVADTSPYYKNNSKYYFEQASNAKSSAEQASTSALTYKNEAHISAERAQQAANNAVAISDPEGWRTSTTVKIGTECEKTGVFHFGSAGGALQTSGNPMYGVLDQSHCITFELDEDWSIPTSVAASLNMFGDNFYESGYRGIGATFSTTGRIAVRVGDGSSNGGAFQYVPLLRQIFGGSNEMIIPAGKYAVCFCIHFGDTTQDSDGNYLNPSTCKIYTNGVYKCACGQLKHKVDNAWVVFGASEVVWSQNSKLGFFDTTNFHKTDSTSFNYGHYEGKANRFAVFNFDMSAADAPYTPSDYASGKKIPLALCSSTAEKRCILATADYTFGGKVRDISGNENHLTVCGDVKGDKDEAVKQMYNAFSAAYTAENATA